MNLGIGTAQFGMAYGIANKEGQTPAAEVAAIIAQAARAGLGIIDTAHGYGESEAVLGAALPPAHGFRIVTKTPAFPARPVRSEDADALEQAFLLSLTRLRQPRIFGLLAHSADDLLAPGGDRLVAKLMALKDRGLVGKVGASVYNGEQIDGLVGRYALDLIQLPVNALDQRLVASGRLAALKQQGVEVHARSIFLQGLLLMAPEEVPAYFDPIRPLLRRYHSLRAEHGLSAAEAAFCFVTGVREIDEVIVGVDRLDQLERNVAAFRKIYGPAARTAMAGFAIDESRFLNPSLWRLHAA